ncbi:MAG TPA: cytochrome b/b6 domain-containing protein [Bauldia sp.]|nr:cytochrome b/b6 domain-containing protein [Bauldia sp.]
MSVFGTENRYGLVAQAIHWITAILVLTAWLIAGTWGRDETSPIMGLHQSIGFTVFALVLLRLVWRLFDTRPPKPPMPGLMALAARVSHWLLYALLVLVPLSAIVGTWREGHALMIYGSQIEPLISESRRLGHQILDIHHRMATVLIALAGLHALAAIFHHLMLRDRTLRQMLPVG